MRKPSVDWRFAVLATLILTCLVTLSGVGQPQGPSFVVLHHRQTMTWLAWLLLTPGIIAALRRFPFGEGSPIRWLIWHLLLGGAFAIASVILVAGAEVVMKQPGLALAPLAGASLIAWLATGMLLYTLISVSYQALTYHRAARVRDAAATRLRADLAEARLANIEGKLQPHFLFNALNSIASLMRADPRQAEVMLEQLSELLHATLRASPTQEVPLDEALRFAEQYLAIEQRRFGERLRASVQASEQARQARIPPLVLQPLVENAVRHGISALESGGLVSITAAVDDQTLLIRVEDDGVGVGNAPPSRRGTGLGLQSVRSILSHLYGSDQRFDIQPRSPRGTLATIAMPFRSASS